MKRQQQCLPPLRASWAAPGCRCTRLTCTLELQGTTKQLYIGATQFTSSGELGSSRLSVRDWLHHLQNDRG